MKKTDRKLAIVILAAGKGSRMKSDLPKPMHKIGGLPMISHVLKTAQALGADKILTVLSPDMPELEAVIKGHSDSVYQAEQLGTGDAVKAALPELEGFQGNVLVLYADAPLLTRDDLQSMIAPLEGVDNYALSLMTMHQNNPTGYGRIIKDKKGDFDSIVEEKDANKDQKRVTLCNAGVLCCHADILNAAILDLKNDNAQKEYYLTDIPAYIKEKGHKIILVEADPDSLKGANDRVQLAELEKLWQHRKRREVMQNGVTLVDPDSVFFSWDTIIGTDSIVEPNVQFGPGVVTSKRVKIRSFSYLEDVKIESSVQIGPFSRIRGGSEIKENSEIGNFVEVKNASFGLSTKAKHLSYVGDAKLGDEVNISCGVITVNWDGDQKYVTNIGDRVLVGAASSLIAPVTVENDATIAAGSTITKDVPAESLAICREREEIIKKNRLSPYQKKKQK